MSITLHNILTNPGFATGDFTGWSSWEMTKTIDSGQAKLNASSAWGNLNQTITTVAGHKYYIRAKLTASAYSNQYVLIQDLMDGMYASENSVPTVVSDIFTATGTSHTLYVGDELSTNGDFWVDELEVVDMTADFGSGNEPASAGDFEALCPDWFASTYEIVTGITLTGQQDAVLPEIDLDWT